MTLPHTKSSHKVQARSAGTSQALQPLKKATSTNLEEPVPLASAIKATSAVALAFSEDKNALEEPSGPVKSSPTPHTVSFHEFCMKWKKSKSWRSQMNGMWINFRRFKVFDQRTSNFLWNIKILVFRYQTRYYNELVRGTFLAEDTNVFAITSNRRTFFFTETENLNFGDL